MVNLVALVLIVMSSSQPQPTRVDDLPHVIQQSVPASAVRSLTPEQKAWFSHAIDDILRGE